MSKMQLRRDRRAILATLPLDGSPMTMADVMLRAGEGLYPAMQSLVDEGRVKPHMIGHLHAYAVVPK